MSDTTVSRRTFIKGVSATATVVASGMPMASQVDIIHPVWTPVDNSHKHMVSLLKSMQNAVHDILKYTNDYNLWRKRRLGNYQFKTDFFVENGVVDWKTINHVSTTQDWWDINDLRVIEEIVANDPNYGENYFSREVWESLKKEYKRNSENTFDQILGLEDALIEDGWFDSLSEDEVKELMSHYSKIDITDNGEIYTTEFNSKFAIGNTKNRQIALEELKRLSDDRYLKYRTKNVDHVLSSILQNDEEVGNPEDLDEEEYEEYEELQFSFIVTHGKG